MTSIDFTSGQPSIHILLVEDDPDDAELIKLALKDAGLSADFRRVETSAEMNAALDHNSYHVIISDYSIPGFGGPQALSIMQARRLDIPFIIVSGAIGEDTAVALMKSGVHDYVVKGNLTRLPPVVERELREAAIRRARREAEQSLRQSQQQYESLIQSIDGIVWQSEGLPGPLTFVSQQAHNILGFPIERWLHESDFWRRNIYEEDRAWVLEAYQSAILRGRPFQLEYRRFTANGETLWLRDVISITATAAGEWALRGVTFDVTERRQAENERERLLKLTEQRAREMSIIATISAALRSAATRRETLAIVLETMEELLPFRTLSYHPLEAGKIGPSEVNRGDWPADCLQTIEDNRTISDLLSSTVESVVLPILSESCAQTAGKLVALPLRAQGQWIGVIWGHYQTSGPDKAANAPLSVSENRLITALADIISGAIYRATLYEETQIMARQMEELMVSAPQGLILMDERRRILLANPEARRALELLSPQAGHNYLTTLGDYKLESALQESMTADVRFEVSIQTPALYTFEIVVRAVNTEFAHRGWVLTLHDVTEERITQERIEQQNRLAAVGQLAAGIAHDFNNSLGVIRLYTELVQQSATLSERDGARLQLIAKQIEHAAHLIHQILDFSRRSIIERKALDLHRLLSDLFDMLERTLGDNINIVYEHDDAPALVNGDITRLQQALFNLIVNARDAMPNGGQIHIRLASHTITEADEPPLAELTPGSWASISVSDTGHGIDNRHLPQLFEPFFTTKPPGQGTGLGLAQVYGIVKQHNGHVAVDTQVDRGTTFTLYFPSTINSAPKSPTAEPVVPVLRSRRILVVEDDAAGRKALEEVLQSFGYTVASAANGAAALVEIDKSPSAFDLIVSDLVMPKMSGIELYRRLQQNRIHIPMIIVTGYPLADGGRELLEQGIVDWIAKPFQAETLLQKIEAALYL